MTGEECKEAGDLKIYCIHNRHMRYVMYMFCLFRYKNICIHIFYHRKTYEISFLIHIPPRGYKQPMHCFAKKYAALFAQKPWQGEITPLLSGRKITPVKPIKFWPIFMGLALPETGRKHLKIRPNWGPQKERLRLSSKHQFSGVMLSSFQW